MAQSILIVDDENEIVSMLYRYFSKLGYTVYTATAGKTALKEVEKNPNIILLDVNMPDIDGFTICERIRDYVSCPIIFLTANKGIVFDRETIYEEVWGLDGIGDNTVVTEHIRRIRAKFLSLGDRPYIETVWGCGYKWEN